MSFWPLQRELNPCSRRVGRYLPGLVGGLAFGIGAYAASQYESEAIAGIQATWDVVGMLARGEFVLDGVRPIELPQRGNCSLSGPVCGLFANTEQNVCVHVISCE